MSQNSMFGRSSTQSSASKNPRSAEPAAIWILAGVLSLGVAASGCKPKIGDDCTDSTECSQSGDRVCDTSQPGGYCTVFNCEPGSCPKESTCIAFRSYVSAVPDPTGTGWVCSEPADARFQRTFCMVRCKSDSDCRSGYRCVDLGQEGNAYGAEAIDTRGSKVCTVAFTPECASDDDCPSNERVGEGGAGEPSSTPGGTRFLCIGPEDQGRCWPEQLVSLGADGPETVCSGSPPGSGGSGAQGGSGGEAAAGGGTTVGAGGTAGGGGASAGGTAAGGVAVAAGSAGLSGGGAPGGNAGSGASTSGGAGAPVSGAASTVP